MRAIVVDDEKLALESMCVKLKHIERISGIQGFSSSEAALEYFAENGGDIAFLDIQMARLDGLGLAARMREIKPGVIIIFVTGYAEYALDALRLHADGYLMKPMSEADIEHELDDVARRRVPTEAPKRVRVQCFGDFEVFVDNAPVPFTRSKSKELLAYLIDRRGAKCSTSQIAAAIWEDDLYSRKRQKLLSIARADMIKSLKTAGAEGIVQNSRDGICVLAAQFDCDYYSALDGDREARSSFTGEYMNNYSWAEFTAASLCERLL